MNKRQKIVQQRFLDNEETVINKLKNQYSHSLKEITKKTQSLQDEINRLSEMASTTEDAQEKEILKSREQAKIYQKQYQDALKKQVGSILDNMQVEEFKTVSEYLEKCYEDGFIGTMYDLQGQGIPLCFPLDQESMVRAIQTDSKISQGLYTRLGEDVAILKKKIAAQISRGISTGITFQEQARQLAGITNIGFNNAVRITRTEGHRIQIQSGMDACYKAKEKGADIVKQWDSTLDSSTRESHQKVDGEIRELDKPFSNGLMYPGDPAGGAEEVIGCRCALLQRAKWALDEAELEILKNRAAYYGLNKTDGFEDFEKKYLKAMDDIQASEVAKLSFIPAKTIKEAELAIKSFVDDKQFGAMGISYSGISIESANAVNEALFRLYDTYDLDKLGGVFVVKGNTKLGKQISDATAAYSPVRKTLLLNNKALKDVDDVVKSKAEELRLISLYKENSSNLLFKTERARKTIEASLVSGRATVADNIADAINHEIGHSIEKAVTKSAKFDSIKAKMPKYAPNISGYATTDMSEYIAESFTSYLKGEKIIDPDLADVFRSFEKDKNGLRAFLSTDELKNLDKMGSSGIILSDRQFGRKIGKHAKDFGLNPGNNEDRNKLKDIIADIIENKDDYAEGDWRGQPGISKFYIKDENVVVVNEKNEFVTILKGGVTNERVKNARK